MSAEAPIAWLGASSQYMPKFLGQPISVVDRAGASGMIGANWLLQQPADGYTVMLTPAMPFIPVNILVTNAHYKLEDFTFVNAQWTDYTVLIVPKDRPRTAAQLIDAIRAKWIKQHLRIKAFYGNSENAVKTQIWIAVSIYLLVAIVRKRLGLEASLYQILQILSVTLFEKTPTLQALQPPDSQEESFSSANRLILLDL
jgi:hypothetical protein